MAVYEIFNRAEGLIWFLVAAALPFMIPSESAAQRTAVFIASAGFILFGISDFLEAPTHGNMPAWLWALKIGCATLLLACRFTYIGWKNFRITDRYFLFGFLSLAVSIAIMIIAKR